MLFLFRKQIPLKMKSAKSRKVLMSELCLRGHGEPALREKGNVLLLCIILMSLLMALCFGHVALAQKGIRQSNFFSSHTELLTYAESGISLALHDLKYDVSPQRGNFGTLGWLQEFDAGRDGIPGTLDDGEADGIPTIGEPHVFPIPVGRYFLGNRFIVHVDENFLPGKIRIVSTATSGEASATMEKYFQKIDLIIPKVGSFYIDADGIVDLGGDVLISGREHHINGSPAEGPAMPGISLPFGEPEGENASAMISTIRPKFYHRVEGSGGRPSIQEIIQLDFDRLVSLFREAQTQSLLPGTYPKVYLGDVATEGFPITYTKGDLHLAGRGIGAGVLVVDGNLTVTGGFNFTGLILVKGDFIIGGNATVVGSVLVHQVLSAVDQETNEKGTGFARILYSSEALDLVQNHLPPLFSLVHYNEK